MIVSVKVDHLKSVLKEARKQFASVAVCNRTGEWSNEYFQIDEIKDVVTDRGMVPIIILHSDKDSKCTLLDMRLISGVKFNKYLSVRGTLTGEVGVVSEKIAPLPTASSHLIIDRTD